MTNASPQITHHGLQAFSSVSKTCDSVA